VPLASDKVAWSPALVDCRYFTVVPDVTKLPTVLVAPFLNLTVPAENVKLRVDPWVNASPNETVPLVLTTNGKSIVRPLDVIVCVPEGAANVVLPAPAPAVIVAESVKLP